MTKTIRKSILCLLTLTLMATLLFTGCDALIDNGMHRTECEAYLNAMLAGDFEAAHAITPAINEEQHRAYFEENCKIIEGAKSYTLTQTGWNINTNNGITTKTASYQIVTDNGLTCQFTLNTVEGYEGIANIGFHDTTAFAKSAETVEAINTVLTFVSLIPIAFSIWMLVDCIKRKMNKKVWWIILTLLSFRFSYISGPTNVGTNFFATIFLAFSSITAEIPTETLTTTIVLPLGALIYFFRRKKLSAQYATQQAQTSFPPQFPPQFASTPESVAVPPTVTDLPKPEAPSNEESNSNE